MKEEFLELIMPQRQQWLGLDIGSTYVRIVELAFEKKRWVLKNAHVEYIPSGFVVDGRIEEISALAEVISQVLKKINSKTKQLIMAVPEEATFTRVSKFPASASEDELLADIREEAGEYIPFDLSEVGLDFFMFQLDEEKSNMTEVLTVAARNEFIQDRQELADLLKLRLKVVEVSRYATWNSINYFLRQRDIFDFNSYYLVVNLSSNVLRIKIYKGNSEIFGRDTIFGDKYFAEQVAKRKQINISVVRNKMLDGTITDIKDIEDIQQSFLNALEKEIDDIMVVAKNTFGHINFTAGLLVSNGYLLNGIDNKLSIVCGVKVMRVAPFYNMGLIDKMDNDLVRMSSSAYVCACGLAMRGRV